ncbi:MAG: HD domain-containing protein [Armatimonadota bacterium]|nr:HD domain-containing protein [Armatimonadota bacterium]
MFRLLGGMPGQIEFSSVTLPAIIGGPLAHQVANNFFVSYAASRWRGTPFLSSWFDSFRDLLWPNLLSIPTAVFLAILSIDVHHIVVMGYLALLPFQWQALRLYLKRRQLYTQIVDGLVVAADVNFPLGKGHARRVADLAVAIARKMLLSESIVESVQFAALLHDVGMIGKDDLLDRPVLTMEDAENLLDHVRVGAAMARELPRKEIAEAILYHHERFDGTGYPGGLRGGEIPLPARIIALAEAVDSMAFGIFPYSPVSTRSAIVSAILSEKGKSFDPEVVDAFMRAVEGRNVTLDYDTARQAVMGRIS